MVGLNQQNNTGVILFKCQTPVLGAAAFVLWERMRPYIIVWLLCGRGRVDSNVERTTGEGEGLVQP